MRVRLQQQEAAAKTKDKEVERLLRQAEQAKAAEGDLVTRLSDAEEAARIAQTALATARQRVAQAEALTKTRDREVERLNRLVDAAKSEAAGQGVAAGKSATRLEEEVKKLEAALAQAQVRLLAEQLRDAQNMISVKDRTGGWRNPGVDAEIQSLARRARTPSAPRSCDAPSLNDEPMSLKREVEILERRLSSLKHGSGGGGPDRAGGQLGGSSGVAAEGGELALGLAGVGR
ncbi:uncharacterized protein HaLaN_05127 [Haematococcus lacustris]|uniref:Uncharacterized protein n=1 Tax=Haematococcus lacustris TaxID=44745 RepID=A0A699YK92_HAELA|nr:uncharacterized protein HaLaN_05127 [Haematococcus lacustris]